MIDQVIQKFEYIGWAFEFALIAWGVGYFLLMHRANAKEIRLSNAPGFLPSSSELKRGVSEEQMARFSDCPILKELLAILRPKASEGLIQEEALLSALEDEVHGRGVMLKELAGALILTGLFCTFVSLSFELHSSKADVVKYQSVIRLVGLNWPAILGGLICTGLSSWARQLNESLFRNYRRWLESDIFPMLGASRGTMDQLKESLRQFNNTAGEMIKTMAPLQQMASVLQNFQSSIVCELAPAIRDSLVGVSVGLSDAAMKDLRALNAESKAAIARIVHDQARILSLYEGSEHRVVEIASSLQKVVSAVTSISDASTRVGNALSSCSDATMDLKSAVQANTAFGAEFVSGVEALTSAVGVTNGALRNHLLALPPLTASMEKSRQATEVAGVHLQTLIQGVQPVALALPALGPAVQSTSDRWQEAIIQMGEILESMSQRTSAIESTTKGLLGSLSTAAESASELNDHLAQIAPNLAIVTQNLATSDSRLERIAHVTVSAVESIRATESTLQSLSASVPGVVKSAQSLRDDVGSIGKSLGDSIDHLSQAQQAALSLPDALTKALQQELHTALFPTMDALKTSAQHVGELAGSLRDLSGKLHIGLGGLEAERNRFNPVRTPPKPGRPHIPLLPVEMASGSGRPGREQLALGESEGLLVSPGTSDGTKHEGDSYDGSNAAQGQTSHGE